MGGIQNGSTVKQTKSMSDSSALRSSDDDDDDDIENTHNPLLPPSHSSHEIVQLLLKILHLVMKLRTLQVELL